MDVLVRISEGLRSGEPSQVVRLVRTVSSEVYVIWEADRRLGQVDLHYADGSVQADLFLEAANADHLSQHTDLERLRDFRCLCSRMRHLDFFRRSGLEPVS